MRAAETCIDADTLAAYIDGALSDAQQRGVDTHIDRCAECRSDLSALAMAVPTVSPSLPTSSEVLGGEPAAADSEPLEPGTRIGRYVVLGHHGRGGMGLVVRAYDPELDRQVAIKLLHPELWHAAGPKARERLQREAKAMARLAHPNVVRVHDVGEHGDQIFLAMEFVEGRTLRAWSEQAARTWRQSLDACVRAGRGLVAAHEAGLVHRDFKPENVLCSDDGRVLVTDFGLARAGESNVELTGAAGPSQTADARLTQTRALLGTPAYMAPELFDEQPATTKTDQFAFCVTAYEVVYGHRPFRGDDWEALRDSVREGAPAPPTGRSGAPAALGRLLCRGLAPNPRERFETMDDLLGELDDQLAVLRRRWRWGAALAMLLVVAGAVAATLYASSRSETMCRVTSAELAGAWDDERRAALQAGLTRSARDNAGDTFVLVAGLLDDYAARWVGARTDACAATHQTGEQSAEMLDVRMACLDRRKRELGELTELLASSDDPTMIDRAVEAVYALRQPGSCDAESAREFIPLPPDPDEQAQIEQALARLDRGAALRATADYGESERIATEVVELARQLDYPPLLSEALLALGQSRTEQDQLDAADAALFEALNAAAAAHDDRAVAEIWVNLVMVAGPKQHRFEVALAYASAAEVALARIDPSPAQRARFAYAVGSTLLAKGDLVPARERLEEALSYRTAAEYAPLPPTVGGILGALCSLHGRQMELDEARAYCVDAIETSEAALGPVHPKVAIAVNLLGAVELAVPDYDAARAQFERVVDIMDRTVGETSVTRALALGNLGLIAQSLGELDVAESFLNQARDAFERYHPGHPQRVPTLTNLANVAYSRGQFDKAIEGYEYIIAVQKQVYGPRHDVVAQTMYNLALVYQSQGRYDEAEPLLTDALAISTEANGANNLVAVRALDALAYAAETKGAFGSAIELSGRALDISESLFGPDHPETAAVLWRLGNLYRLDGEPARSLAPLERALAIYGKGQVSPYEIALVEFSLARALWQNGRERPRAVELARSATQHFATGGAADASAHEQEVVAWLAQHGK